MSGAATGIAADGFTPTEAIPTTWALDTTPIGALVLGSALRSRAGVTVGDDSAGERLVVSPPPRNQPKGTANLPVPSRLNFESIKQASSDSPSPSCQLFPTTAHVGSDTRRAIGRCFYCATVITTFPTCFASPKR